MTQIRPHRFTLEESMAESESIRDFDHLMEVIHRDFPRVTADQVHIRKYSSGPDSRIGWPATYLIEIEGQIPWGMADGPVHQRNSEWTDERFVCRTCGAEFRDPPSADLHLASTLHRISRIVHRHYLLYDGTPATQCESIKPYPQERVPQQ